MPRTRDAELLRASGSRLQRARMARAMTQEALAERLAVDLTTLSKWESGARAMSISSLAAASEALGIALSDLVAVGQPVPEPVGDADVLEGVRLLEEMDVERRLLAVRILREMARR